LAKACLGSSDKMEQEIRINRFSELFTSWNSKNTERNLVFKDFYKLINNIYPSNKKKELKNAFEMVL
jgi:hypothetical protein